MKQSKLKQKDEEVRKLILAGASNEAIRLRRMLEDIGYDLPVSDLDAWGQKFVLRVEYKDGLVSLCSTISFDLRFLLFGGGGLLAEVMPDRSVAAIADLLERSPEVLADAFTRVAKDRSAAFKRLFQALKDLPIFEDDTSSDVMGSVPRNGGHSAQAGEQRS